MNLVLSEIRFKMFPEVWLFFLALQSSAFGAQPDFSQIFKGKDGCFILYDIKTKTTVASFNEKRCSERFVACSTFKIPLALMAFDKGLLKDENSSMKWNGKKHAIDDWNHDQTAASWMKHSVVWFSQQLTPQLGMKAVKDFLRKFDYGNQDMSGGLTTAWLTSGSKPSLKISAKEQVRFLERLWSDELSVSKKAMELTRKVTYLETSPRGSVLHGKTGSTLPTDTQMGWFVGHVSNPSAIGHEYVFAVNFEHPTPKEGPKFAGYIAKGIAKDILSAMELL